MSNSKQKSCVYKKKCKNGNARMKSRDRCRLLYKSVKFNLIDGLTLFTSEDVTARQHPVRRRCQQERLPKFLKNNIGVHSFSNVTSELRKSLLRHDWSAVVEILLLLLDAPTNFMPVIFKGCFIVLLNHPASTPQLVDEFIRLIMGTDNFKEVLSSLRTVEQE